MKEFNYTRYACDVCGKLFQHPKDAQDCESNPVREDRGVKVGDLVRIPRGDGTGSLCKVDRLWVVEPGWGPKQYDHTVMVSGAVVDSWGSRQLAYDSYEVTT